MVPRHLADTWDIFPKSSLTCTLLICTSITGVLWLLSRRPMPRKYGYSRRDLYDSIVVKTHLLYFIDQLAFHIALIVSEIHRWKSGFQPNKIFIERHIAVNAWFSLSEQVKIGSLMIAIFMAFRFCLLTGNKVFAVCRFCFGH